jgi:hypothetical protein
MHCGLAELYVSDPRYMASSPGKTMISKDIAPFRAKEFTR